MRAARSAAAKTEIQTDAATIMIGEKGADMIFEDAKAGRSAADVVHAA